MVRLPRLDRIRRPTPTGLSSGTTYYYRVMAYSDSGDSGYSNEASATTAIIVVPPAAPSGLVANVVSSSQISLSWVDNSDNENGFKVERKTGAGGEYSQIAVVGANGTSFPDSGLSPDTIYYYRVRSYNTAGDSAYSNESSATTLATVPMAPSSLPASAISSSQVDLTWVDNAANESGFKVERKEGAGGTYSQIGAVGSNIMSYSDTGLTLGTNYCYRVRAYNGVGDSDYSNEACVATPVSVFAISGQVKEPNDSGIGSVDIIYGEPEVLDQYQVEAIGGWGIVESPHWQEFTPSQPKLAKIEFGLGRRGDPGDILISITDSESQTLWSATIPQDQIPMNVSWISVAVEPTLVLVPETIYKIHWTTSIPSPNPENRYWLPGSNVNNNYYTRGITDVFSVAPYFDYGFRTYSGDAAISTDSGGYYQIHVASGWSGTVTPSYSNYVFTPASRPYPSVTSDQANQDYTHVLPPVAPSGLSAGAVSSSEINISWTDNSNNETGFRIERKTGSGGTYGQIATVGQNTTAFPDTGLSSGTTYYYRVVAYNDSGDSPYSNEAFATTAVIIVPPIAPSGLTANVVSSSQINLSWVDNSDNENGFKVERKTGAEGTYSQVADVGADVTSLPDSGLSPDTTYYYRVWSYNTAGDSAYSNESSATTPVEGGEKLRWFVKDVNDYYLWMNTMLTDESFEGWQPLQGGTSSAAAAAVFNDRLHVVVKDAFTNVLWHQSMDGEGTWSGWTMLDKESPSTPSLAVFDGKLYLAVQEPDNRISCKSMDASGIWSSWTDFPGATSTTPVLAAYNGKLHLVVKDLNFNFMWWNSMDTTGTWSGLGSSSRENRRRRWPWRSTITSSTCSFAAIRTISTSARWIQRGRGALGR